MMFCPAEMEEMAEMKSLKRLNDQDKLLWLMNNQNQENPFLRKVLLSEYLTLLVLILLVSELPASLKTNIVIP